MSARNRRRLDLLVLWLSLLACVFFTLAGGYAAAVAETGGDLLMGILAVPAFAFAAVMMASELWAKYRDQPR